MTERPRISSPTSDAAAVTTPTIPSDATSGATVLAIGEARVTHRDVARVARGELPVALTERASWHDRMTRSREAVERRARSGEPFYGVNTGFGASVVNTVAVEHGASLATNLFRFHGCGVGP
ncbi:MAG: aromatic amino acid lyase, partial [Myxococcales bacterium]|nr:aromatic amino acid lyase [Myxococcales bacterium]